MSIYNSTSKSSCHTYRNDKADICSWNNDYPYPLSSNKNDKECNCEDWDSSDSQPKGERWQPLGAPNDDEDDLSVCSNSEFKWYNRSESPSKDKERLRELEDEQEQLNNSLLALTSHFAQVQFRLKQIVDASPTEKESLLVDLEEFANRGIPDLRLNFDKTPEIQSGDAEQRLGIGQERQRRLISQLKQQLEDLENYAYETGEAGLPQSVMLRKQRAIIDQLKSKLNLNVDDFDKVPVDDLKHQVDKAIKELINPLRMKEQLVDQLQTQIVDLERFIEFLQDGGSDPFPFNTTDCKCEGHTQPDVVKGARRKNSFGRSSFRRRHSAAFKDSESILERATTILSMLTFAQFGCGSVHPGPERAYPPGFERNELKKTASGYHWGDLRAALEVAIASLVDTAASVTNDQLSLAVSSGLETEHLTAESEEVTLSVRKGLCPALRDLIQHGLMPMGQSQSLVPFLSCFPSRSSAAVDQKLLHAWDFVLKYYNLKKGDQYNKTPARQLSESFNLDIRGGCAVTNKQLLLQTVGAILSSHGPLKRSYDSHFKAFVSAALNKKILVAWLRLMFRCQSLVEQHYAPWSYVTKTGFEDALRSLEQLNKYYLNLPVDLAVKPFLNIKDVFN